LRLSDTLGGKFELAATGKEWLHQKQSAAINLEELGSNASGLACNTLRKKQ